MNKKNKNGCCGEDVSSPCITVQPSASQVSEGLVLQGCKDPTTLSSALDNGRPDDHGSSPKGGAFLRFLFGWRRGSAEGVGGHPGCPTRIVARKWATLSKTRTWTLSCWCAWLEGSFVPVKFWYQLIDSVGSSLRILGQLIP